ncbi:hypothetical protein D3C80_1801030 [compost metagenome]
MNRVGSRTLGDIENLRYGEVALGDRGGADQVGFGGEARVGGLGVGLGVDRYGRNSERFAGAQDPQGNFPTVGDQDLVEHAWSL